MTGDAAMTKLMPVWAIWTILAGASIVGFALAEGMATARIASVTAILLAAVKIHLIFGQYMEVRWSHQPLRGLLSLWLTVVTVILVGGYMAA